MARVMALPLMFSITGITMGTALDPAPRVMASGIGDSMGEASNSLESTLSRTIAQPAVFCSETLRPSLA